MQFLFFSLPASFSLFPLFSNSIDSAFPSNLLYIGRIKSNLLGARSPRLFSRRENRTLAVEESVAVRVSRDALNPNIY